MVIWSCYSMIKLDIHLHYYLYIFFKSMCYITNVLFMYFYLLTFSQNYDLIILSKINPTKNGLKTIHIFISATYTCIRNSEALHVKIYKFINPLKKNQSVKYQWISSWLAIIIEDNYNYHSMCSKISIYSMEGEVTKNSLN